MADKRDSLQAAPPDAGGHQGEFTRPGDLLVETTGQAEERRHKSPPLHTDPARNEPTATYEGTRGGLIGLVIVAVIVIIALLGLLPAQGLFDTDGRQGAQQTEQ